MTCNKLHHGDCLEVLATLQESSFTACVTDPPYGLEFMGKGWDRGVPGVPYWEAVLRVLKPGAMLLAFGGTRTHHRLMSAIEDAGFEIRDCLMWLYGSGFPKSMDVSKAIDKAAGAEREIVGPGTRHTSRAFGAGEGDADYGTFAGGVPPITAPATDAAKLWSGYGTALKPAWEPIILAMKPFKGTYATNALENGVAGLNVDGCRVECKGGSPSVERRKHAAPGESVGATGWVTPARPESYNEQRDGEQLGRWPANVILDEAAGEILGEPSRFFYCAKANKKDRTNNGTVENKHPTVKPRALMEYLCRVVTPPGGGVILDPFMGSGSTGLGARATGNEFVGIELEEASYKTAKARITCK